MDEEMDYPDFDDEAEESGKDLVIAPEPVEEVEEAEIVEEVEPVPSARWLDPEPEPEGPTVSKAALKFSERRRNSVSVAVVQDRLRDMNYGAVRGDMRGHFHVRTREAIEAWQTDNGLEVTGELSDFDLEYLFDGTNVRVTP